MYRGRGGGQTPASLIKEAGGKTETGKTGRSSSRGGGGRRDLFLHWPEQRALCVLRAAAQRLQRAPVAFTVRVSSWASLT